MSPLLLPLAAGSAAVMQAEPRLVRAASRWWRTLRGAETRELSPSCSAAISRPTCSRSSLPRPTRPTISQRWSGRHRSATKTPCRRSRHRSAISPPTTQSSSAFQSGLPRRRRSFAHSWQARTSPVRPSSPFNLHGGYGLGNSREGHSPGRAAGALRGRFCHGRSAGAPDHRAGPRLACAGNLKS